MYKITLEKEDFLRYQLFTASQSKRIRHKRVRTWLMLSISFLLLGLSLRLNSDKFPSNCLIVISIITFISYPFYERRQYRKHYEKHIDDNYKNRIGVESELGFEDGYLVSKGDSQEGKIKLTEIQEINEISENLFIKIKSGESLIIPSNYKDFGKLKEELNNLLSSMGIEWKNHFDWKWK